MELRINITSDHRTALYAAEELSKYLKRIAGANCHLERQEAYIPELDGIWLGPGYLFPNLQFPEVADPLVDDALAVSVDGANGIIAGNNPRSILIAVYRYLHELGCRWVRPGAEGEYLPSVTIAENSVHLTETPSYRHRGLNLANALTYDNLLDIIEWGPKIGLNGFMLEYDDITIAIKRLSSTSTSEPTEEDFAKCKRGLYDAVKQRDMLMHSRGHGWIWDVLGVSLDEFRHYLRPECLPWVAQVKGKRQVFGGGITNLCYGNPEVRKRFGETVANWAQDHSEVDYLHVWEADGTNRHCECDICRQARPADWYMEIMNEIDEALNARALSTRIVFCAYMDLLWPPEQFRIKNTDRFILMFAPFLRSYSSSFELPTGKLPELPPYRRNKLTFAHGTKRDVDFLQHWRQAFSGDAFVFDYHYWLSQYDDPSSLARAEVLHDDIIKLETLGLNGIVGCYSLQSLYPTGLGFYTYGRALWSKDASFDELTSEYIKAAFGPDWRLCLAYLEELGQCCDQAYLRGETDMVDADVQGKLAKVPEIIADFKPVIQRNCMLGNPCWAASWKILARHAELTPLLVRGFEARAQGDPDSGRQHFAELAEYVKQREAQYSPFLDSWLFCTYLDERGSPELVAQQLAVD